MPEEARIDEGEHAVDGVGGYIFHGRQRIVKGEIVRIHTPLIILHYLCAVAGRKMSSFVCSGLFSKSGPAIT